MQLVINIPESTYHQIQALARNNYFDHDICGNSMRRIANGVPLPKGHGRLIDADELLKDVRDNSESYFADDFAHEWVDVAPTIIEADEVEK